MRVRSARQLRDERGQAVPLALVVGRHRRGRHARRSLTRTLGRRRRSGADGGRRRRARRSRRRARAGRRGSPPSTARRSSVVVERATGRADGHRARCGSGGATGLRCGVEPGPLSPPGPAPDPADRGAYTRTRGPHRRDDDAAATRVGTRPRRPGRRRAGSLGAADSPARARASRPATRRSSYHGSFNRPTPARRPRTRRRRLRRPLSSRRDYRAARRGSKAKARTTTGRPPRSSAATRC